MQWYFYFNRKLFWKIAHSYGFPILGCLLSCGKWLGVFFGVLQDKLKYSDFSGMQWTDLVLTGILVNPDCLQMLNQCEP